MTEAIRTIGQAMLQLLAAHEKRCNEIDMLRAEVGRIKKEMVR